MISFPRTPDFSNLQAVLERKVPARPTLFEFFLHDALYDRLAGDQPPAPRGPFEQDVHAMLAFAAAGYDHFTLRVPGFDFPGGEQDRARSISQNQGARITDWASFHAYPWPDPDAADYAWLDQLAPFLPGGMKMIVYGPSGVLENAVSLVGYEALCILLSDDPKLAAAVIGEVGARLEALYARAARHPAVGACISNDDWGFKTQTLFSPRDMRKYIFPWHKRIVARIHEAGKPAILHSCGHFTRIIDDVIDDIGFDARHSYEDAIMPVEEAYERYHDRIAILGGIDLDFVIRAPAEEVYRRSKAMLERTAQRGGYALGTGNSVPDYTPDEQYFAMTRAALEGSSLPLA